MSAKPTRSPRSRSREARLKQLRDDRNKYGMDKGTRLGTRFQPLSDDDIHKIHGAALRLLETVGMATPTPRILDAALAHGCSLSEKGRLLFPRQVVEKMLELAAKDFTVYGRNPAFDFEARNDKINFCTGGAAVKMLDIETHQYRSSTLSDLYDLARVADTLENIQWFARPVVATDIPDLFEFDANTVYACAAGTQKHIATSFSRGEHVYKLLPMLDNLAGGDGEFAKRPFCTVHATTVVSPMNFAQDSLDVACAAVDIGMPVHLQTGPQAGATAPAALAGTLVQVCAEGLASLSVINMIKPGHPAIMGNWAFVSDLRTGAFTGGGGEQALLGAASGQMSAHYGIPGGMGAGMADSKIPDNQAGFEKALTTSLAALSGSGFVFESAGMLASLMGCSIEAMIIDNEMLSSIRRIARGIEVTEETLSVEIIGEVTESPGHFLGTEQTMALMKTEYIYPEYSDRSSTDDWADAGSTDIWHRAANKARSVLASHYPQQISAEIDARIRQQYKIHLDPAWKNRPPV